MTKREVCIVHKTIAVCHNFGGLTVKHIECGMDDYLYIVSSNMGEKPGYHRLKIYYGKQSTYIIFRGIRHRLNEFVKV